MEGQGTRDQQMEEAVMAMIQEALVPIEKRLKGVEMGGGLAPFHKHNGIDAPQIALKDLSRIYVTTVTAIIPNLLDTQGTDITVYIPGPGLGDFALCSFSKSLAGMMATAYVSAANEVKIRLQNETGGAINLGSTTVRVMVLRKQS